MIGPVTIGGKSLLTLSYPITLINPANTTYTRPAIIRAPLTAASLSRNSGSPILASPKIADIPPMKANDEPKNTGTFLLVTPWNISVPTPAQNSVIDVLRPVKAGTNTVAPNIASTCCSPRISF